MVRDHFKLPADRLILCAVSFGYAVTDHPANSFRTQPEIPDNVIDWKT
jgi:hypothetical protein